MQLPAKNTKRQTEKETLRHLHGKKKLQFIWDYYKLPLAISGILFYSIAYLIYRQITYQTPVLYTAFVNVAIGETLTKQLSDDFLESLEFESSKNQVCLYTGLYLTDNENNSYHQYSYASRIKILASIDAKQLDVVLMNQEAFDTFSQNGYLCNLEELLSQNDSAFYHDNYLSLVNNTVILEDNAMELQFDPSVSYYAVTETYPMGLDLSQTNFFQQAGFQEPVYFGIIENSSHKNTAISYLRYLFTLQ